MRKKKIKCVDQECVRERGVVREGLKVQINRQPCPAERWMGGGRMMNEMIK